MITTASRISSPITIDPDRPSTPTGVLRPAWCWPRNGSPSGRWAATLRPAGPLPGGTHSAPCGVNRLNAQAASTGCPARRAGSIRKHLRKKSANSYWSLRAGAHPGQMVASDPAREPALERAIAANAVPGSTIPEDTEAEVLLQDGAWAWAQVTGQRKDRHGRWCVGLRWYASPAVGGREGWYLYDPALIRRPNGRLLNRAPAAAGGRSCPSACSPGSCGPGRHRRRPVQGSEACAARVTRGGKIVAEIFRFFPGRARPCRGLGPVLGSCAADETAAFLCVAARQGEVQGRCGRTRRPRRAAPCPGPRSCRRPSRERTGPGGEATRRRCCACPSASRRPRICARRSRRRGPGPRGPATTGRASFRRDVGRPTGDQSGCAPWRSSVPNHVASPTWPRTSRARQPWHGKTAPRRPRPAR